MNTLKNLAIILAVFAIFITSAHGQSFLNLNFESAYNLPGNPGSGALVPVTDALPGWTAHDGNVLLADISYVSNSFSGYSTAVELEGGSLALSGDFSAGLYPDSSINQTGLVPIDAESLQFEASSTVNLEVALGGQNLSYSALSSGPGYVVYGANIPVGMDGQPEPLTFDMQDIGETLLDNIQFSTSSVPEPGEWGLICVGAVLFWVWWRWLIAPSFVETSTEGRKSA